MTKENLVSHLEKKGLSHYIAMIVDSSSVGLYQRSPDTELGEWWKKMLIFYNLSALMIEHKEAVNLLAQKFDEASYNRLTQITNDMNQLKKILEIQD